MCKGETSGWPFTYFNDRASNFFLKFDVRRAGAGAPAFLRKWRMNVGFPAGTAPRNRGRNGSFCQWVEFHKGMAEDDCKYVQI